MDELCNCQGCSDKVQFLIPEDSVLPQQHVGVCKDLPMEAAVFPQCSPADDLMDYDDATCCFEKALHCLAMVDATLPATCPSPRSHHCLMGAYSPASSDSDDELPSPASVPLSMASSKAGSSTSSLPESAPATVSYSYQVVTTQVQQAASCSEPAAPQPAAVAAAAPAPTVSTAAAAQQATAEAPVAALPMAPPARAFHHKTGGPCDHCGATESPQWRRGPACKPTLCNACGTRYRRTNQLGPAGNSAAARAERAGQHATAGASGHGARRGANKRDSRDTAQPASKRLRGMMNTDDM